MKGLRLVDSILEMKVELLRAGSLAFEYRVDAERRYCLHAHVFTCP
jgi:hypothetical protein